MRINKLLLSLLAIGTAVRLIPIFTGNIFYWFDQGLDTILVKQLVIDHKFSLVSRYSGLAGVLMGPVWTWLMSVPFALSGGNPLASSLFLSLISIISSIFTYGFIKKYYGCTSAIIATALTLITPSFVANSLIASSPNPLTTLFIFYLWFAYELFVNEKKFFWLPLLLLTGLFFQFEVGFALFTLPSLVMIFLSFRGWQKISWHFFVGLVFFGLTFLPQAFFDVRHDFLISHGILNFFTAKNSLYGQSTPLLVRFGQRAWSFGDDFITMLGLIRHWLFLTPLIIVVSWGWLKTAKKDFLKLLLIILGTFYVGFSFFPGPLWTWYRAGLPIVYILLVAIPLGILWDKAKKIRPIILIFLALIFLNSVNFSQLYLQIQGQPISDNAILKNQLAAIDYVYQTASGQPFSYFAYTPPVYDYIWEYHFWWYGQKKYGYLPTNWQMAIPLLGIGRQALPPTGNEKLYYLIIEPNRDRPWEISGWVNSYTRSGNIISTKTFPGEIVVQKVTHD